MRIVGIGQEGPAILFGLAGEMPLRAVVSEIDQIGTYVFAVQLLRIPERLEQRGVPVTGGVMTPREMAGIVLDEVPQLLFTLCDITAVQMVWHQDLRQDLDGMASGSDTDMRIAHQEITDTVEDHFPVQRSLVAMIYSAGYEFSTHISTRFADGKDNAGRTKTAQSLKK